VLGEALVEGIRIPITDISLRGSQMVFRCMLRGPVAAVDSGTVTIFGEDGSGICQGHSSVKWKEIHSWETLKVEINMQMDTCYGDAEEKQ
jgi:hypothetical protein